jgi:hypothetical protein
LVRSASSQRKTGPAESRHPVDRTAHPAGLAAHWYKWLDETRLVC